MNGPKLSDLDELILMVREPESRRLLVEAVNSYRGGAFRSALISTWIAVAYDIIAKIRKLAARGEAQAKAIVDDLTQAIEGNNVRRLQEIECSLLSVAQNDFELLLSYEATEFQRLFEDRHLCAHPAFVSGDALFTPSPELIRTYIAHAVHHLLAHPPVQGKSVLQRLHRDILGMGFPSERNRVETVMRDNYLYRTKETTVIALAKGLLLTPLRGEREKFKGREQALALAFAAVGKIRPDLFEREMPGYVKKIAEETSEPEFLELLRFVSTEPRCWNWISEPARIRMTEHLAREPIKRLIAVGCFNALHVPQIAEKLLPRVSNLEEEEKFNVIADNPSREFVDEAILLYSRSRNFRSAELRGEKLILSHAKFFTAADVKRTLDGAITNTYSQILNASGTSDILSKLFEMQLDLLPETKSAWGELGRALVAKSLEKEYTYPALFLKLAAHGIDKITAS